jgi:hypothetical protein
MAYNGGMTTTQTEVQTATAYTKNYVVPAGKVWKLKWACIYRAQTGLPGCNIIAGGVNANYYRGATSLYANFYFDNILLAAGDMVRLDAATGTSGTIDFAIGYEEYAV